MEDQHMKIITDMGRRGVGLIGTAVFFNAGKAWPTVITFNIYRVVTEVVGRQWGR